MAGRVCNERGEPVAVWYLFSNAPADVSAETLALGSSWRWRSDSFFQRLHSAGPAVEPWQPETGAAVAKRWLVAALAGTVVWKRERATTPEALAFRALRIRWSGRPMQ